MKEMKKMKKANEAVSDVLGTILLLGITISLFSVLSVVVLSYPFNPNPPSVNQWVMLIKMILSLIIAEEKN